MKKLDIKHDRKSYAPTNIQRIDELEALAAAHEAIAYRARSIASGLRLSINAYMTLPNKPGESSWEI